MSDDAVSWHYTPGVAAATAANSLGIVGIMKARLINPSSTDIGRKERPVIWFSAAQRFEPTAAEISIQTKSGLNWRALNVEDQAVQAGGLYRFGLPARRLIPYLQSFRDTGISSDRRKRLARVAKRFGSEVRDWSVYLGPLALNDPDLEFAYFLDGEWHSAPVGEADMVVRRSTEYFMPLFERRLGRIARY